MRNLMTFAVTAILALGMATAALADDTQRFQPARDAIEASGLTVLKADPGKDFRGKPALVLKTDKRMEEVVEHFKTLYRKQEKFGTATVIGLAHIVHSDTWNVTLKEGKRSFTFKVSEEEDGARMTIREPMGAATRKRPK
jgi:hypothetical protein